MQAVRALTAEQNRLVEENIKLTYAVAGRFSNEGRDVGLDYDDLVSLASIGLCRGAQLYDASISKPTTYLWRCCARVVQRGITYERLAHGSRVNAKYRSLDAPLPEREDGSYGDSYYFFVADPCADVEESVVSRLYAEQLQKETMETALSLAQTDRERRIIRRWVDGMTLRAIAKEEGISMQAVQQKTSRCRKAMIALREKEETQ